MTSNFLAEIGLYRQTLRFNKPYVVDPPIKVMVSYCNRKKKYTCRFGKNLYTLCPHCEIVIKNY